MRLSIAVFLSLILSSEVWSEEVKTVRQPSSYFIRAQDGQGFSLRYFELGDFPQYTVNFTIGQREQERRFADKEQWEKWRNSWTYLQQSFPAGRCAHPLNFISQEQDKIEKTKAICLEKLTPTEREDIKKFVSTLAEFLYGK